MQKFCRMCGWKFNVSEEARDCPDVEECGCQDTLEEVSCSNCVQNLYSMPRTCTRCKDFNEWTYVGRGN